MTSLLFVCLGNICRSPTAEAVFRARLPADVVIESAGTGAWHAGNPPDPRARAAGQSRGYSFAGQTARAVHNDDFAKFDQIYAMDAANLRELQQRCPPEHAHKLRRLLDLSPEQTERNVPDPYYGGDQGFEHVLDLIEGAANAWLEQFASAKGAGRNST
ncbi:low molecular weight protein-tyrosine-phosphatase [Litorimonas sp. RW-G-Af-16]|uniref:low molecular weight protein-tyrosine-phosphatase n=1 Tax=Litorimonas sp. RW-G-Af-16 TaxID=3241168 RepID=UPI00390CA540